MWPKRKIWLVGNSVEELPGILALLEAFSWDARVESSESLLTESPPSDLVFGPGVDEQEGWIQTAKSLGIDCCSTVDFLHKIWRADIVLSVAAPEVILHDHPLLWELLATAGFEPSLLWPADEGTFLAQRGKGGHWVVSAAWLDSVTGGAVIGRTSTVVREGVAWEVRDQRVDFYWAGAVVGATRFIGTMPRWPEVREEVRALETIARAIESGITWSDVCNTLGVPRKPELAVVEVESA